MDKKEKKKRRRVFWLFTLNSDVKNSSEFFSFLASKMYVDFSKLCRQKKF